MFLNIYFCRQYIISDIVFDSTLLFESFFIYKLLLSVISKSVLVFDQYLFWFVFNGALDNVCSGSVNYCYTELWGNNDQWEDRIWSHYLNFDGIFQGNFWVVESFEKLSLLVCCSFKYFIFRLILNGAIFRVLQTDNTNRKLSIHWHGQGQVKNSREI